MNIKIQSNQGIEIDYPIIYPGCNEEELELLAIEEAIEEADPEEDARYFQECASCDKIFNLDFMDDGDCPDCKEE